MTTQSPAPLRPTEVIDRAAAREQGRSRRRAVPRSTLAQSLTGDRDVVSHLREQNAGRLAELVPLRMQRMLANPFAFYRGTAGLMAMDLSDDPNSGIHVAACGDAHLSNFGFYASPERRLMFDLNDFDEAALAPWEWDLKRLLTSVIIGGRHAGYPEEELPRICRRTVTAYVQTLRQLTGLSAAERYFMHFSATAAGRGLSKAGKRALSAAVSDAERRTGSRALRRTTERAEDGRLRFVERPPTMTRVSLESIARASASPQSVQEIADLFGQYRGTVDVDIDLVLSQYTPTDLAMRVVGVGSVGTRCYLQLLEGPDSDALVLQVKEAGPSVLVQYGRIPQPPFLTDGSTRGGQGFRVVGLQRVLQAVSDPFLGYLRGAERDFYVRQFNDMKGSIELEGLALDAFADYAEACAVVLGRAHAQSPAAIQIVGYVGQPDSAVDALTSWSLAYADRAQRDFDIAREAFADELSDALRSD